MTLADVRAIALALHRPPTTIRTWIKRHHIPIRGHDQAGRNLYAVEDLETIANHGDLSYRQETQS